jgi:hypothetical protein
LIGSLLARNIVKNPEIIHTLDQRFIIIYDIKVDEVGIAINIMAEQNWEVKQCWSINSRNSILLEKS